MVARTQRLPSSSFGINSPPIKGTVASVALSASPATTTVSTGCARTPRNSGAYTRLMPRTSSVSRSALGVFKTSEAITGENVRARMSAPVRAKP